jgi:DNA-binding NarL/FixJ family response regulator
MNPLRILIADDHPVFRHGLRALLESTPEMEVAAEVTTGKEAITQAEALQPDVVLMDIQMPDANHASGANARLGINGVEATRRIVRTSPHIRVLMVTMFQDDGSVFAAMRAGARGYILKDATSDELLRSIRAVGNGEAIFSPAIASRVLAYFAAPSASFARGVFPELTDREREILDWIVRGATNAEIAAHLALSVKTVSNYVSNIFSKLQVADRVQAIIKAREAGLE